MFHKVGLSLQVDLKIQQRALRVKMYQRRQIVQISHTVENTRYTTVHTIFKSTAPIPI